MKKATLLTDMLCPSSESTKQISIRFYLIFFYNKMAVDVIYLNFGNGLKTSTIFLYPSLDITTWMGELLDG